MEIFAVTEAVKASGLAKFLLQRHDCSINNHLSVLSDVASEASPTTTSGGVLYISAGISPVDSFAPPIVRPNSYRTVPRTLARKKSRTRKRSLSGDDGEEDGFFGDGDDGPFGGSGGGGGCGGSSGGKGWNFGRFGGANWEDESSSSFSDPAFDFVYEVISWIALSNCIHFAFKKVVRVVADGIGDPSREKVPVC